MYFSPILYHKLVRPKFLINKHIKNVIKKKFNLDESKILDFGCGTGSNSFIFKSKNYLGVDIDKKRIDFAKKTFPKYKFELIKDCVLPVADNSFDYICIFATIHHISDSIFQKYLKEFKRILKNDGEIIIIEPFLSKKYKFNNLFMKIFDDGNFIRSENEYKKLFNKYFSIIIHKKIRRLLFYNELLFSAKKNIKNL